jgi:molybdopterin-guanine dinucleotide biosynthesis protein A
MTERILGAVLTGGRSSRFGRDKAAVFLDGRRLVDHAVAVVAPHVAQVVTIGAADDRPAPGLGPLGGIAGALTWAAAQGYDSVLTIACDMPAVPDDVITDLLRRAPAYCVEAPVLGHWRVADAAALVVRLEAGGERSIRGWARAIGAIPIASAPIVNINTPADLALL